MARWGTDGTGHLRDRGGQLATQGIHAPALRRVVMAEATRRLGSPISLELFAADNRLVPSFFARHPEPLAEGADALAQPDWGRSRCSCGLMHCECVFAFPPRGILQSSWRRRARTACVGSSSSRSRLPTRHGQPSWPPRSRPSTDSATRASSCPTWQRTSGRAMTSAARSAWLSLQSTLASGASVRHEWGSRRRVAGTQSTGRCSRFRANGRRETSAPRGGAPAARPAGGQGRPGQMRGASII